MVRGHLPDSHAQGAHLPRLTLLAQILPVDLAEQATPHVAGLIAYLASQQNLSPSDMLKKIKSMATLNAMSMGGVSDQTPNVLIYNGGA
jgi:hypothetical protein